MKIFTNKGTSFKKLTILDSISRGNGKHKQLICECSCGKIVKVLSHNYKKGKHCICNKHLYNDATNKIYGKVKVIKIIKRASETNNKSQAFDLADLEGSRIY